MYTSFWLDGLVFVLTYLVFGVILAAVLRKCVSTTRMVSTTILVFGLAVAPWLTALLVYFQFHLFPKIHPVGYISIVLAVYALLAYWARRHFRPLQHSVQSRLLTILTDVRKLSLDWKIALTLCGLIMSYILYQSMAFPIVSHDGSVYAFLGEYLFNECSLVNYPMVVPDPRTGARMTLEHPPGLPLLYTWFHLLTPGKLSALPRSVSAIYSLYTVFLLFDLLAVRKHLPAAVAGTLVMLLVPAFVWQSFDNSVDPPRLFLFFGSLVLLSYAFEEQKGAFAAWSGLCAGFAAFVHASGVLMVMVGMAVIATSLCVALFVANRRRTIRGLLWCGLAFGGAAALVGSGQYISNWNSFHNVLGPAGQSIVTVSVASVSNFYSETELAHRNQVGEFGKLIFGRLQIFSRPELFGLAIWMFLVSLVFWKRSPEKRTLDRVLLIGLLLFAVPVMYKYYSNRRYILTIIPCVVYFNGLILADVYIRLKAKRALVWGVWGGGLCGVGVIVAAMFLPSSILSNKLGVGSNPFQFITASKSEQNLAIDGGLAESIQFVNKNAPKDSVVLVSDERFFVRSDHKGVMWGGMNRLSEIYRMSWSEQPDTIARLIDEKGVGYLLFDHASLAVVKGSTLGTLLENETFCVLVHDGESKVWKWKGAARRLAQKDGP